MLSTFNAEIRRNSKKESLFLKQLITKNRIITYEEMENHIWDEDSVMTAVPYHKAYANEVERLAKYLEESATYADNASLKNYKAKELLSDDGKAREFVWTGSS